MKCQLAAKTPLIGQPEFIHETDVFRSVETPWPEHYDTHTKICRWLGSDTLRDPRLINGVRREAQTPEGAH